MVSRIYAVIKAFVCKMIYRLQSDEKGFYLNDCKLIIIPLSLVSKPAHCK